MLILKQHLLLITEIKSTTKADGQEYKQYILDICQKMNDRLGETVQKRVLRQSFFDFMVYGKKSEFLKKK